MFHMSIKPVQHVWRTVISVIGNQSDIQLMNDRPECQQWFLKGSPNLTELEAARPQTVGEEELQLQLALAMSKEEAEQEEQKKRSDDVRLQMAISQSEEDYKYVMYFSFMPWQSEKILSAASIHTCEPSLLLQYNMLVKYDSWFIGFSWTGFSYVGLL